jgi:hypothetical protein
MQFLDMVAIFRLARKSEHQYFKGNMGQCKSEGEDSKRDYAKEKLRENM